MPFTARVLHRPFSCLATLAPKEWSGLAVVTCERHVLFKNNPVPGSRCDGVCFSATRERSFTRVCGTVDQAREAALRVALFITCYNDTLFPETGRAVVRLLERLGHTVEFPAGQTCCGQMHYNTGYPAEAMPLLRRVVDQLCEAEAVVVPSSSCVAMMRDHYPKMALASGDP